jgi:hypothetical protein
MMTFGQVLYGKLHWKFDAPSPPQYAPTFVFVDITGVVPAPQEGWLWNGTVFSAPPAPALVPIPGAALLDSILTEPELEALQTLANGGNVKAQVFLTRVRAASSVSSQNPRIIAAFAAMVAGGIMNSARRDAILASFG